MRDEPWMHEDERSLEQIRQDRLRALRHEEAELERRLEEVRREISSLAR